MSGTAKLALALGPWLVLALLAGMVTASGSDYLLHLAIITAIYAILAMSLDLAFGYTGLFSIAHAALFGIGAYATGLLMADHHVPLLLAIGVGGLVAAAAGTLVVAIFSRMDGPYFAIGTFAFCELVRIVLNEWRSVTHGPMGVVFPQKSTTLDLLLFSVNLRDKMEFFILVAVLTFVVAIVLSLVLKSRLGGRMTYVRDDPNLAMSLGVNVLRTKLAAFAISGFIAGVAGGLFGIYLQFIAPTSFSGLESVRLVMMVVIGGAGTLFGPILGTGLIVLLPQAVRMDPTDSLIITGVILVLVVLFLPKGIFGSAQELLRRRLAAKSAAASVIAGRKTALEAGE
jgi:branched-chain amino acid transport system permease protein